MDLVKIKGLLKLPLSILFKRIFNQLSNKFTSSFNKAKILNADLRKMQLEEYCFTSIFNIQSLDTSELDVASSNLLLSNYQNHRFSILGSPWLLVQIKKEELISSLHPNHRAESVKILDLLFDKDPNYQLIDWQLDLKSSFRFNPALWYKDQRKLIQKEGIDIKVPWELGRMQHLTQLAVFALKFPEKKDKILVEFRSCVLDFVASNPYNMGVNWACAMDVGIRAANLLLAYDLLQQIDKGGILDNKFKKIFISYLFLHAKHITENFEYHEGQSSNHYLGNIAGLAFVASYLSGNQKLDEWLLLAIQEFSEEMPKQFLPDGANFEGSTAYHRLSAEFFAYVTALLNNLSPSRRLALTKIKSIPRFKLPHFVSKNKKYKLEDPLIFSTSYYEALAKMKIFSLASIKPNGNICQIGDNDSGRFFKLTPVGQIITQAEAKTKYQNLSSIEANELPFYDENDLYHGTLIAALDGLFQNELRPNVIGKLEFSLVSACFSSIKPSVEVLSPSFTLSPIDFKEKLEYTATKVFDFDEVNFTTQLKFQFFQDFGMLVFRNDDMYLNIAVGNRVDLKRTNGHKHNDLLSFELNVKGKDVVLDPGTYLYTPYPKLRNKFRSTKVHNTIFVGEIEQNEFSSARNRLFVLESKAQLKILRLETNYFKAVLIYNGIIHLREIKILENKIIVSDSCNKEFQQNFNHDLYSNGYGKLIRHLYE